MAYGGPSPSLTPQDAVNITIWALVPATAFMVFYWLAIQRPLLESGNRRAQASILSVRGSAIFMAFVTSLSAMVAGYAGYLWFFGIAAYGLVSIAVMCWGGVRMVAPPFRSPIRVLALGNLPLAVALALAWATYLGRLSLPITFFWTLCSVSGLTFIYVAMKPTA